MKIDEVIKEMIKRLPVHDEGFVREMVEIVVELLGEDGDENKTS